MNDLTSSELREPRLRWSPWSRCESSFSLVLVPGLPGVFVIAEEVIAPGETPVLGERRMLAVLKVADADDLGVALSRLFVNPTPLRDRLLQALCFVRYAVIADPVERHSVCASLENWLAGADAATASRSEDSATSETPIAAGEERQGIEASTRVAPPLPAGF